MSQDNRAVYCQYPGCSRGGKKYDFIFYDGDDERTIVGSYCQTHLEIANKMWKQAHHLP